jgi:hypothetical protein
MGKSQSIAVAVAEGVRDLLRARTGTLNPEYGRTYDTTMKLEDMGVLHVDVVGAGHKLTPIARDIIARDPIVQVVIRKRLSNPTRDDDDNEQDRLALLTEEIECFFAQQWLGGYPASWQACETVGPVDEHYAKWRQFTTIITMTFRVAGEE